MTSPYVSSYSIIISTIVFTRMVGRALLRRWCYSIFIIYLLHLFQNIGCISFLKSKTSLSFIKFVEKYIKIHKIKFVLLDSSWNEFSYFIYIILWMSISLAPNLVKVKEICLFNKLIHLVFWNEVSIWFG